MVAGERTDLACSKAPFYNDEDPTLHIVSAIPAGSATEERMMINHACLVMIETILFTWKFCQARYLKPKLWRRSKRYRETVRAAPLSTVKSVLNLSAYT